MTKAEEHAQGRCSGQRDGSHRRQDGWEGMRVHRATQNSTEFKVHESLIPGIFHLTFLGFTAGNWKLRKQNHRQGGTTIYIKEPTVYINILTMAAGRKIGLHSLVSCMHPKNRYYSDFLVIFCLSLMSI